MSRSQSKNKRKKKSGEKPLPGIALEKTVARIQQLMDPNSQVTHNEKVEDRFGLKCQCDVVIRGAFAGRPILGIIECRDHKRKLSRDAVGAFSKKCDNLNANLKLMVSRKGFSKNALTLAHKEGIGCLSLLPDDPRQTGFSIGEWWYGIIRMWVNLRLVIHFALDRAPIASFNIDAVKWEGKPVIHWYWKELLMNHGEETHQGDVSLRTTFDKVQTLEIDGKEYPVKGLTCIATRIYKKKRKWISWSGDAFYDWHTKQFTIPQAGIIVGSAFSTDLSDWNDYDGDIPDANNGVPPGFIRMILYNEQKWDNEKEIPDLSRL